MAQDKTIYTSLTGFGLLNSPALNKGTAFTEAERDEFFLHGLLPPQIGTLDQQVERRIKAFRALNSSLEKYVFMRDLQDHSETIFYALVSRYIEEMLPIVYTPTVGEGCQRFSEHYHTPRGVYLSYPNKHRIAQILSHPRYDHIRCIVVSDGERILGLGDQGAGGMGIPIGKLALYTALAGIHPMWCLPVFLDVGTDNQDRLDNPLYIGWKNRRIRGKEYDEFVEEFVRAVRRRWPHVLLQWEDFAGNNASRLLERYRTKVCSFNDDIQGTAAVSTATILASSSLTGIPLRDQRVAIFGFGSAGTGIAQLLAKAMQDQGLSQAEARSRFFPVDIGGLVLQDTPNLRDDQKAFAQSRSVLANWQLNDSGFISLEDVVRNAKPTVLIGVSGQFGAFNETIVREMARHVARPAIFPLSNPTSRAEATPLDLLHWTEGRAIIGTGSPWGTVEYNGAPYRVAQTNNSYIFPGLALGIIMSRAKQVSDGMIMASAKALAAVTPSCSDQSACLLPEMSRIREVSTTIALAVGMQAQQEGLAAVKGDTFEKALREHVWEPVYVPYRRRK
ncbi:NAD-dependent malic enzyme [Terriglobus albidus]|uniref:NAD-dependent malic enzyme n=1 Tax=Terriglobus albidus TaxID=1592106 RepID=A0A5B9E3D2_9BACT|nr:NAD-dependent malic enzyme [Terriglobus albidus]QEE26853.1 NAD-dependent malic enzyme [Terriglobus albidus]